MTSESTAENDVVDKQRDYAALGITEYWRFDRTHEHHNVRLAGDRVADGAYVSIPVEDLPDGRLRGYSAALNFYLPLRGRATVLARPGHRPAHPRLRGPAGPGRGPSSGTGTAAAPERMKSFFPL